MHSINKRFIDAKIKGHKLATLTAYDYPMGRLLDTLGLDLILVGDSLGMVIMGYPDTTHVTMADMLHHTKIVARGVQQTLLIADIPIHGADSLESSVENARSLLTAGAQGVKLEGGAGIASKVEAIVRDGIPVLGHIGMLPQQVKEEGGYRIKGKTPEQAEQLLADALALEAAGAFGIVLELVTPPIAREISRNLRIPTIGIGSGPDCDGQILVIHDLLGFTPWFKPHFVQPRLNIASDIQAAVSEYIRDVRA